MTHFQGNLPPRSSTLAAFLCWVHSADGGWSAIAERDSILDTFKYHLSWAQKRIKDLADHKLRDVQLSEGDLVYVKLKPYHHKSLAHRNNEKLAPCYFGPYPMEPCLLAFPSTLSSTFLCRNVSWVLSLTQPFPIILQSDLERNVELKQVVNLHYNRQEELEVLIKWQHLPSFENTGENFDMLNSPFPSFHVWEEKGGVTEWWLIRERWEL